MASARSRVMSGVKSGRKPFKIRGEGGVGDAGLEECREVEDEGSRTMWEGCVEKPGAPSKNLTGGSTSSSAMLKLASLNKLAIEGLCLVGGCVAGT